MASTPDQIARAFCLTLTPGGAFNDAGQCMGGVPVGGVGIFVVRTPITPYRGMRPIVLVRCVQNVHGRAMAAGGQTLGKIDQGYVEMIYRDAPLTQQKASTPNLQMYQIEDAAVAARNGIVVALDADNTLGGTVTIASEQIEEIYAPDGEIVVWQGAEWIGWQIRVSYQGSLDD